MEVDAPRKITISGHFNKAPSSYWSLALPALSVRYVAEVVTNYLTGPRSPFKNDKLKKGPIAQVHAIGAGSFMMGVSGYYLIQTYRDMRNLFAEPLSWELNKKPENINIFDIMKSKNSLVEAARKNFFKYNARRIGVNTIFFSSLLPGKLPFKPDAEDAVKLGTGANGLYLMNDVLHRKETFFEALQTVVATKINHAERVGELITANDLMNLYDRHGRDMNKAYSLPQMNTPEWQNDLLLFGRIADLMNQTYGNKPNTEKADFTIPKLIYLLGNGLVKSESLEKNLAYVELANRSQNMDKVNAMAAAFKDCKSIDEVLQQFSLTLPVAKPLPPQSVEVPETQVSGGFVGKVAAENRSNGRDVAPAASHVDALQKNPEGAAIGMA
jgi:hypothetical protein